MKLYEKLARIESETNTTPNPESTLLSPRRSP